MRFELGNRIKFCRDYIKFKAQSKVSSEKFTFGKFFPCLRDWNDSSGIASGHYFHQDLLVAQKIFANNPLKHVDIGSRIDGFVAHVASFREIEVIDVRPLQSKIKNIEFKQIDFMEDNSSVGSYSDSISCLHALEHFGLGRYGDPVDFDGYMKGFKNLTHMLNPGGLLYFSVPIGEQRIEFNAHRVFSVQYLLDLFRDEFSVKTFSYVDDRGDLHEDVSLREEDVASNFSCTYGCGIFELIKDET
ncbi:MAG: DUF268 domain-containing protein [Desulfobulbaceae bacterium]|nr:DUF268 domain-containing protein [Desulfobulbaceae bacterium]